MKQSNDTGASHAGREGLEQATQQTRSAAEQVLQQTGSAVKGGVAQARELANSRVDQAASDVGAQLKTSADALQQSLQPLRERQPAIASLLDHSVARLQTAADRIERQDLQSLMDETSRFARERPLVFAGAAAFVGVVLGRFAKAVADADAPQSVGRTVGRGEQYRANHHD